MSSMSEILVYELHGEEFGGNFGQNKTLNMVEERFFWSLIRRDVEKYAYLPVFPKCKRGFTQ